MEIIDEFSIMLMDFFLHFGVKYSTAPPPPPPQGKRLCQSDESYFARDSIIHCHTISPISTFISAKNK